MEIFVSAELSTRQAARVRELAAGDRLHLQGQYGETADPDPAFAASEVAFGNVPATWLAQAPTLRWIQLFSVGVARHRGWATRR